MGPKKGRNHHENIGQGTNLNYGERDDLPSTSSDRHNEENRFDDDEVTYDFRKIDILPSCQELTTKSLQTLRSNIIKGPYKNTNHYLEVQFQLMREHYISPIRKSIIRFRTNPDQKKYYGGRFYKNTRFLHLTISQNRVGLLISFDDQPQKNKYKVFNKFLYGSLLCFSDDDFSNIFFGTVVARSEEMLAKNMVVVELVDTNMEISVYGKTFVMFESDVFFPKYGPVLEALKSFGDDIPMQNYIVDLEESNAYPAYITNEYKISCQNINVRDENDWERLGSLDLDKYQFDAFKMALTREFVTIQGPPGTGKTFIGLKIVETLLENISESNFPILVLCYTNHALDQFLEGILKSTQDIIRIGGQSKNEKFAYEYNLNNLRKKCNITNPYHADLIKFVNKINFIQYVENMNDNEDIVELLLYERYFPYSKILESYIKYFKSFLDFNKPIRNWLMFSDNPSVLQIYYNQQTVDRYHEWSNNQNNQDDKIYIDEIEDNDHNMDIFESFNSKYIKNLPFFMKLKMISKDIERQLLLKQSDYSKQELEKLLHIKFCELSYLEEFLSKRDDSLTEETFDEKNIHSSNPQLRWQIYWYLKKIIKDKLLQLKPICEGEFRNIKKLYEESSFVIDSHLLKDAKVVGVTTTAAARLRPLLQLLAPSIVIVDEAAEILESHIVVNLTDNCKQVILIGDHQQLSSTTESYRLRKQFNLDISLFEKMFANGHNCVQLAIQHRMRSEISNLITPAIYPKLHNHRSVRKFPDVRGINKNVFFVNHNIPEKEDSKINSKSNVHEAEFVIALTKYLIQQGYSADDITIIVAYSEQLFRIRELQLKKSYEIIKNVRISFLDDFQGKENKIIILSLVRSNNEGGIGFLSFPNRVSVALSRAKEGFYIIGNMDLLTSQSELWEAVKTTLINQGSFGKALPLECKRHNIITPVFSAENFQNAPEGGCLSDCDMLLECGHFCKSICHPEDNNHRLYKCRQKCDRKCDYGHKCKLLCYQECECKFLIKKMLPCEHELEVPCYADPNEVDCPIRVDVTLPFCFHTATVKCFETKGKLRCKSICGDRLPCGHVCKNFCHKDEDPEHLNYICCHECAIINKNCSKNHPCIKMDYEEECGPCLIKVPKKRNNCQHTDIVKCYEDVNATQCKNNCGRKMPCGHQCNKKCFEECTGCLVKVSKKRNNCQHTDIVKCHEDVNSTQCIRKCIRIMACGHQCKKRCYEVCACFPVLKIRNICQHAEIVKCHEDVNATQCKNNCARIMPCGHHCKKKCYEECTGCSVKVKKTRLCGHQIIVKCEENVEDVACENKCQLLLECGHSCRHNCGEECGVKNCIRLVVNNFGSICGHDFKIPCYLTKLDVGVDDIRLFIMQYCIEPCYAILQDCKHICKGTCGSCQSRLHQPCSETCGVTLVCGHGCRDPCRKACNMCKQPCEIKCVHSKCNLKCRVPCRPCNMPCPRQCRHKQCSKNCGDICDTPPCSKPCEKIIECGHPCSGLCGDQCPKICKICSPDEFPELLFGDEDDDDARFISLVDCPHSVEVTGLDKWVASKENEIHFPTCPYCKTIILNTPRYSNQIKIMLKSMNQVKLKLYGNLSDIVDNLDDLESKIKEIFLQEHNRIFVDVENWTKAMIAIQNNIQNINLEKYRENILLRKKIEHRKKNNKIINLISKINVMKCILELFKKHNVALKSSLVVQQANFILNAIAQSETNLSKQQVNDINNEIFRIKVLVKLVINQSTMGSAYKKLIAELFTINVFNDCYTKYFNKIIKMFGIISDKEKNIIVKAKDHRQCQWYKCPNGHIYCNPDCGGAVVTGTCPECGASIGDTNHLLREDSSL